jgi:hypothetical protein
MSKPKNFQSGVGYARWRQASGQVVNMADMEVRHLENCLRLCERYGNTGKAREIREHLGFRNKEQPYDLGEWQ